MAAVEMSLNESAEDLMTMTMESSMNRDVDPQEEAENIRRFLEKSGAAGGAARSTPGKRVGSGWVPTQRPVKLVGRNAPPAHRTEDKENVANEASFNAARPRGGSVSRSPAAATAAVKGKRATPKQRRGTGRAVTTRPVEFRRRAADQSEPEPSPVREVLPNKGRRTGLRMRQDIAKDVHGLEDLSEFWDAVVEDEPVEVLASANKSTRRVSFKASVEMSPVSHRASTTGRPSISDSITSSMSVAGSQEQSSLNEGEEEMDMDGESPVASSRRSSGISSVGRRISERISTGGKGLNSLGTIEAASVASSKGSALDSSLLSPDANTIKQLTFDEGSERRRSSASSRASSRPAEEEEEGMDVDDDDEGDNHDESAELEAPEFDQPDEQESMEQESEDERDVEAREEEEEEEVVGGEEGDKVGQKAKRRGDAETRKRELEALAKSGRASYGATDSYATKQSRLSMFAPRPESPEEECRRSKRRKMRPLEYWRNERVIYSRANKSPKTPTTAEYNSRGFRLQAKSFLPEVVDVQIRSPAATPWRRKYKGKDHPEPEASSSVDSKSATVKKKARSQKKKERNEKKEKKGKKKVEQVASESDDDGDNQAPEPEASEEPSPAPAHKEAPKEKSKPKTAFFLFCKERRPDVRRTHPDASIPEQAMILSEMWRGLKDTDKAIYKSLQAA